MLFRKADRKNFTNAEWIRLAWDSKKSHEMFCVRQTQAKVTVDGVDN
jgi:hypothetical protein